MKAEIKREPLFTVSIATFNNLEYTRQCLEALFENTPLDLFDLVIVDNASRDGTQDYVTKELPQILGDKFGKVTISLLLNQTNVGFGQAHNQSGQECKTPYLLLLNNDTIPLPGWLTAIAKAFEDEPTAAVVGSKLVSPLLAGGIQHAGVIFVDGIPRHRFFGYAADAPQVNRREYVPAVTGACLAVRKHLWDEVINEYPVRNKEIGKIIIAKSKGGLNPAYRNGWEDIEFCLRVREMGWQVLYEPKSVLYHYEGVTEGRLTNESANRELFLSLWAEKIAQWGNVDYTKWKKERNRNGQKRS